MIQPIGAKASAINASSELLQPCPSVLYISGPAKGKKAPIKDRVKVFAAAALAAYTSKALMRYVCTGKKIARFPKAKMPEPIIGMIRCTCASADQPYQNRPMGTTMDPREKRW